MSEAVAEEEDNELGLYPGYVEEQEEEVRDMATDSGPDDAEFTDVDDDDDLNDSPGAGGRGQRASPMGDRRLGNNGRSPHLRRADDDSDGEEVVSEGMAKEPRSQGRTTYNVSRFIAPQTPRSFAGSHAQLESDQQQDSLLVTPQSLARPQHLVRKEPMTDTKRHTTPPKGCGPIPKLDSPTSSGEEQPDEEPGPRLSRGRQPEQNHEQEQISPLGSSGRPLALLDSGLDYKLAYETLLYLSRDYFLYGDATAEKIKHHILKQAFPTAPMPPPAKQDIVIDLTEDPEDMEPQETAPLNSREAREEIIWLDLENAKLFLENRGTEQQRIKRETGLHTLHFDVGRMRRGKVKCVLVGLPTQVSAGKAAIHKTIEDHLLEKSRPKPAAPAELPGGCDGYSSDDPEILIPVSNEPRPPTTPAPAPPQTPHHTPAPGPRPSEAPRNPPPRPLPRSPVNRRQPEPHRRFSGEVGGGPYRGEVRRDWRPVPPPPRDYDRIYRERGRPDFREELRGRPRSLGEDRYPSSRDHSPQRRDAFFKGPRDEFDRGPPYPHPRGYPPLQRRPDLGPGPPESLYQPIGAPVGPHVGQQVSVLQDANAYQSTVLVPTQNGLLQPVLVRPQTVPSVWNPDQPTYGQPIRHPEQREIWMDRPGRDFREPEDDRRSYHEHQRRLAEAARSDHRRHSRRDQYDPPDRDRMMPRPRPRLASRGRSRSRERAPEPIFNDDLQVPSRQATPWRPPPDEVDDGF